MNKTDKEKPYNLTYIVCTKNRLPFLKILFDQFISHCEPDEEIVIIDGNSTDGSKEFLQELFNQGKIHQFISEPDKNQAHGWNKGLLMAKGAIIKKLIDDDVHSFAAVRKCRDFMLNNPQVDICISNCLSANIKHPKNVQIASRLKYYEAWKTGETLCFTFSDVYMLIRKSSLSYLGLFDTQFAMIDWEYSLRCSYLRASIVYYTGYNSLAVSTPGNVSSQTSAARLKAEGLIGKAKYAYKGDRSDISWYSELKIAIGKAINYNSSNSQQNSSAQIPAFDDLQIIYGNFYKLIEEYNLGTDFAFIL